ncbi:serine/arginine repetitive matrix protein 2-like isoform X2 [Scophthalmus maximus]|uniref:serine/arginine repetitive matrix protein 2-like isoform X2 n=1 Tax=Scophthalmus maximus TaxID=52904 RepID=UPI001FA8D005|nr:serine/arginine repetitive matrix protein 2-like isoform X2 [Scophthalmus maximus]XP_035477933.2 serine/arginine repetitive matrix protein 2-like isoform X2 [Scophthalmus maximus]
MTIMDSLFPTIHGDVEDGGELETENCVFRQLLDEVCSDQDFFRKSVFASFPQVELKLNIDYLHSVLSSDPAPLDPLALDKRERELGSTLTRGYLDSHDFPTPELLDFSALEEVTPWEQSQPLSALYSRPPVTDETSLPVWTQKRENLDSPVSSDAGVSDFVPLREPKQEALVAILKEMSHQLSAHSYSERVPGDTPHVKDRAQTCEAKELDTDPNHSGHNAAPSQTKDGALLSAAAPDFFSAINAACGLCNDGRSPAAHSSTLSEHSATDALASDLEAAGRDTSAASSAAEDSGPDVSEDASASFSDLADSRSVQLSQAIRRGPAHSESPPTSGAAGSTQDPPVPRFGADSLTGGQPQSASPPALKVQAWKTLLPLRMKRSEEQQSPRNINPKPSGPLKDKSHAPKDNLDNASTSAACSSFVTDAHPDLLEKSAATSASQSKAAVKAREEETPGVTSERTEENGEDDTELAKIRRQQPSNREAKEGLRNEVKKKDGQECKPSEESFSKTATCSGDEGSVGEQSPGNRRKIQQRDTEGSEAGSSPERDMQGKLGASANKDLTAREASEGVVHENRRPVSPPAPSFLQSPRVQTSAHLMKDKITDVRGSRRAPGEDPLSQRSEGERPGSRPESQSAAACEEIPATETTRHRSSPQLSTDERAAVKVEGAERPHRTRSLMRRHRREQGPSEETDTRASEVEEEETEREILGTPTKRRKWKSKAEGRAAEQKSGEDGSGDKVETLDTRSPRTRSKTRADVTEDD